MKTLLKIGMIISLMTLASCAHHRKCGCSSACKEGQQCSLEKKNSCHGGAPAEAKSEAAQEETKK